MKEVQAHTRPLCCRVHIIDAGLNRLALAVGDTLAICMWGDRLVKRLRRRR
jgi:hypothetical protein